MTAVSGDRGELTPRMRLVVFAFGAASVPFGGQLPGAGLPGPALIRLLSELGLSPGAARSLVLRLRRDGLLGGPGGAFLPRPGRLRGADQDRGPAAGPAAVVGRLVQRCPVRGSRAGPPL